MKKKVFLVTIPMQDPKNLKEIKYRKGNRGQLFSEPTHFPAIPFLEWNVYGSEDVKLVTIRTDDDNDFSILNYQTFKEELKDLSNRLGAEIIIDQDIVIPHEETKEKQLSTLKQICECYEEDTDIYMELTYGTKVTPIALFSSLNYAEKVKHCQIKSIIYGKFPHNGSSIGEIYDVRCLYDMANLMHATEFMAEKEVGTLLDSLWG